jgi:hypothetical protein
MSVLGAGTWVQSFAPLANANQSTVQKFTDDSDVDALRLEQGHQINCKTIYFIYSLDNNESPDPFGVHLQVPIPKWPKLPQNRG